MADLRSYHIGLAVTADNLAAPANDILSVLTFGFYYDGANWDRVRGDATDGLLVNLGGNNDVTITGTVTVDSELPAAAALSDNFANPTAPGVGAFLMLWDGATWDRGKGDSTDGLLVNLGANNDVTVTGTVTVDSELPSAAALADATANPTVPGVGGFMLGYNGATWDRVRTANTGRLQVDVITGGGTDSPTNPASDYVTSAALAAGSEANLDTGDLPAKKLWKVTAWASVAFRARVFLVNNSVEDTEALAVGGGPPHQTFEWQPPHRNFTTLGTSGGTDAFRVEVTNLDDSNAADVHAVFNYADN
jgi:hypothetical protein